MTIPPLSVILMILLTALITGHFVGAHFTTIELQQARTHLEKQSVDIQLEILSLKHDHKKIIDLLENLNSTRSN